jgi:hypothetical protein
LPRLSGVAPRKLVSAALLTAAVCYLPVLLWAPRELIANLLLFNLVRPTNSSSIRAHLPPSLEFVVSLAQLGVTLAIAVWFGRSQRRALDKLIIASALLTIAFVALNKIVHGNYLLWLQPLLALAVAGGPFRAERTPDALTG